MTAAFEDQAQSIKAISFDGNMTLWDFLKVMRHSLSVVLAELHRIVPASVPAGLTVEKMIAIRNAVAAELRGKVVNLEEIRFHAFRRTLEWMECANDTLAADPNSLYLKHRFEDIELYSDVIPCLDILRQEFPIGHLSNGNGYPERCGLQGHFNFVVFAQDVGVEKPDAKMFLTACKEAGCTPSELVHVGDSLASDVAGANGVGAVSVWLNRDGGENDSGITPDHEIRCLEELAGIVRIGDNTSNRANAVDTQSRATD